MVAPPSRGDLSLGKNPGVTSPVLVWWLYLIAKGIIISIKLDRAERTAPLVAAGVEDRC